MLTLGPLTPGHPSSPWSPGKPWGPLSPYKTKIHLEMVKKLFLLLPNWFKPTIMTIRMTKIWQFLQLLPHPQRPDQVIWKAIRIFIHQLPILMTPNHTNPNYPYFWSILSSHTGKTSAFKQNRNVSEHVLRAVKIGWFLCGPTKKKPLFNSLF